MGSCDAYASANVTIQFSTDAMFVMSASTFQTSALLGLECKWNFQNLGNTTEIVVGEQFFKQFYTIFDNDNAQMGFAVSTNSANSTDGPWVLYAPAPDNGPSVLMVTGVTTASIIIVAVLAFFVVKVMKANKSKKN
jgi:hypothetical protein